MVERKHKHLVELGLYFLSHTSFPLSFWDHSFVTLVYLINHLPSPPLNFNTPYHVLFHTFLDYTFLKVFGSARFPFLHLDNSHKLEFHFTECVFLGYSTSHKGYKCMSPSGCIFISKDVLFNEHRFPFNCNLPLVLLSPHLSPLLYILFFLSKSSKHQFCFLH